MTDSSSAAAIVSEYQSNLVENYSIYAAAALACYDCQNAPLQWFFSFIEVLPFFVASGFSALRVFALLDRNYALPAIVLLLGLVPVITNLYGESKDLYYFIDDPILGASCYTELLMSPSTALYCDGCRYTIVLRYAASLNLRVGISATFLRDGSVYFIALLALNLAQLLVETVPSFQNANPVSILTPIISMIMISRFLVDLRQADTPDNSTAAAEFSQFSVPGFRVPTMQSIVGNIGESVEFGFQDPQEEQNDENERPYGSTDDSEMITDDESQGFSGSSSADVDVQTRAENMPSQNVTSDLNIVPHSRPAEPRYAAAIRELQN
ncbi:hypothetical protein NM688_g4444 [Phlebia brevispora]|uniref:Uncharacterized protein n=1 Tax=Phlebia brevispora TaxID=194682 RepID=A0ACC1T3G9_9APHY|nr:hypothetical protein NM688_g4444 [Phlebia brevispora]